MRDRIVNTLNSLIESCKNGEDGYRVAAERVKDPQVREMFQSWQRQRAEFARELQDEVRRFGGEPEDSISFVGELQTDWMAFASLLNGGRPSPLLEELRRSERITVSHYETALRVDLPRAARDVVMRQYEQILAIRDQLAALERI